MNQEQGRFSARNRTAILNNMEGEQAFDVLVIGGGITGAGIALDATTRGMRTALIDMQDFAEGTSSRSTKLIHGGLRYLKQLEIGIVAEVGKERAIVYENGPHVTKPEWMLLPIYTGGTFGKLSTSIGLRFYDYLASVKKAERRQMLNVEKTIAKEPLLKREGLKGSGYYVEYRTDDARLTIEVMKRAVEAGASVINYVMAESFLYDNGKIIGANVKDRLTGKAFAVRASVVVNAAGPWVDTLRDMDRSKQGKTLHLTKGVHLVFDQSRFPLRQSVYFDTPDGRMVFAIPRDGKAYVGTTDTTYRGDIAHPVMTREDRDYLLDAVNFMFPALRLNEADVESSWAGLRPLIHQEGKDPSEISRHDEIFHSDSGLISIAGGKLTGYRKMAEAVVDDAAGRLGAMGKTVARGCRTKTMPISGGEVGGSEGFPRFLSEMTELGIQSGLLRHESDLLARRYGSNAEKLFAMLPECRSLAEQYGLPPVLAAELVYAMEEEMAVKPGDFFIRRTGALFFDIESVRAWLPQASALMAEWFQWNDDRTSAYIRELEGQLQAAVNPLLF